MPERTLNQFALGLQRGLFLACLLACLLACGISFPGSFDELVLTDKKGGGGDGVYQPIKPP